MEVVCFQSDSVLFFGGGGGGLDQNARAQSFLDQNARPQSFPFCDLTFSFQLLTDWPMSKTVCAVTEVNTKMW